MSKEIKTSSGKILKEGDRAYNYYDMEVGVIGKISNYASPDVMNGQDFNTPVEEWSNYWFEFVQDNGRIVSLDGSRICSVEFATRKGWMK